MKKCKFCNTIVNDNEIVDLLIQDDPNVDFDYIRKVCPYCNNHIY